MKLHKSVPMCLIMKSLFHLKDNPIVFSLLKNLPQVYYSKSIVYSHAFIFSAPLRTQTRRNILTSSLNFPVDFSERLISTTTTLFLIKSYQSRVKLLFHMDNCSQRSRTNPLSSIANATLSVFIEKQGEINHMALIRL